MEIWDKNITKDSLYKLRYLNFQAVNVKKQIRLMQEKLSSQDGYRTNLKLKNTPGSPLPLQNSSVEHIMVKKEDMLIDLQEHKKQYLGIRFEIETTIKALEYKLRLKEWQLIRDIYQDKLTEKKLIEIHGEQWKCKLKNIYNRYMERK